MARGDTKICSVKGCDKPGRGRVSLCRMHATRKRRNGCVHKTLKAPNGAPAAWVSSALKAPQSDCMEWPYAKCSYGYGIIDFGVRQERVHRHICTLYHGPPPNGSKSHAAHSCGNVACANPRHIRWATPAENNQDKILHGRSMKGEAHPLAKLTDREVIEIVKLVKLGARSGDLAKTYRVSRGTIDAIKKRKTWRHIEVSR